MSTKKTSLSQPTSSSVVSAGDEPLSEQRQITVLFADLVNSTTMLEDLGPEDFSEVLRLFYSACNEAIRGQNGQVAQYRGDGLVCYFGYPNSGENDSHRTVSTGLAILKKLEQLKIPILDSPIETRIGIASGSVIIQGQTGDFGENFVGPCLNKASRLESLAEPNTVLICSETKKLVGDYFDFVELPPQHLKGFSGDQQVFKVRRQKTGVTYRFDALRGKKQAPLVGRQNEMQQLIDSYRRSEIEQGRAFILVAEAGMGKSKLVNEFQGHDVLENCRSFMLQCSPEHGGTALHPVKEYLEWIAGVNNRDEPEARHKKLSQLFSQVWGANETELPLLLDLLSPLGSGEEADENVSVPARRRLAFQTLTDIVFRSAAGNRNLVIIFEDVHWIDPSSEEFISYLVAKAERTSAFVLLTTRPNSRYADSAIDYDNLKLEKLSDEECAELASFSVEQSGLPSDVFKTILQKSDGVPLFIEEYAEMAQQAVAQGKNLKAGDIPLTIGGLVQSKLDRLEVTARHFALTASTIGRHFDQPLVKHLTGYSHELATDAVVELEKTQLIHLDSTHAELNRYLFKHALVRDAIYASLRRDRRRQLHLEIANHFVRTHNKSPVAEEVVAEHFLQGADHKSAIEWLLRATMTAVAGGNAGEALGHLERASSALAHLPESAEKDQIELRIKAIQGPTQMVTRGPGNPAFGATQERAKELLQKQDYSDAIVPVIYNCALHKWATADLDAASQLTNEINEILVTNPSDAAYLASNTMRGLIAWHQGQNLSAKTSLSATVTRYDPSIHRNLYNTFLKEFGVFSLFYLGLTETVLGNTEAGSNHAKEALELAKLVRRPHAQGFAMLANFNTAMLRGDVDAADHYSLESLSFSETQGFPEFVAMSNFCQGWVECKRGEFTEGLKRMQEGAAVWNATGFMTWQPLFAALTAEQMILVGQTEEAKELLDRFDNTVAVTGESQALAPLKLCRALLHQKNNEPELAERQAKTALQIANQQQARLWQNNIEAHFPTLG